MPEFSDSPDAVDRLAGIPNPPTPARLSVGVISAGRVGTALGAAFDRAGHIVTAASAPSHRSRERAAHRLPEARLDAPAVIAEKAELLILAVPDTALPALVDELAGRVNPSAIVLHTSGALGVGVLAPLARLGCTTIAFHPAMTFVDDPEDTARLATCCVGVTAADEIGHAVGQALALEIGAEPVRVPESARPLYHAALAHGANHLVALVDDAVVALRAALAGGIGADTVGGPAEGLAERVLGPLARAALENALTRGPSALTGPAARGDTAAVIRHLAAIDTVDPAIADAYRAQSRRAAAQSGTSAMIDPALEKENR
ncbi:Rossmann-like and DUF2520 domain-containing protein [Tsukamurella paurometabola]|uniref:Uncharacterized conserved protein n=1 Tax=Tsukamurella paurometabola TaxID=2061 RepID=A0A3P8KPD0_TSUPA|nr:DUF2520 domain-containing protein [Tsukamurella paurometabola]UEA85301.1 DUF2520 domain-containing protein [Tsukamurella paurometabola]VDR37917.1 Uncharacterized conserved protein [Tsukamurella paurometabola]